jgi:hypothetical protein
MSFPVKIVPPVAQTTIYTKFVEKSKWLCYAVCLVSACLLLNKLGWGVHKVKAFFAVVLPDLIANYRKAKDTKDSSPTGTTRTASSPLSQRVKPIDLKRDLVIGEPGPDNLGQGLSEEMQREIGSIVEILHGIEDEINHLKDLKELKFIGLPSEIEAFEEKYPRSEGMNSFLEKQHNHIRFIREKLQELAGLHRHISFFYVRGVDEKGISDQLADGNCLYYSVITGLKQYQKMLKREEAWPKDLGVIKLSAKNPERLKECAVPFRQYIVNHIRQKLAADDRDRGLEEQIMRALEAYKFNRQVKLEDQKIDLEASIVALLQDLKDRYPSLDAARKTESPDVIAQWDRLEAGVKNIEDELKELEDLDVEDYARYCDLAQQDKFFAGLPELYMISSLFRLPIQVYRLYGDDSDAPLDTSNDPLICPGDVKQEDLEGHLAVLEGAIIRIRHSALRGKGEHFDFLTEEPRNVRT